MSYLLKKGSVVEDIDNELVIVTNTGDAAVMNETAGIVLKELFKKRDVEEIVQTLIAKYETDTATVESDLQILFAELINKGLIRED